MPDGRRWSACRNHGSLAPALLQRHEAAVVSGEILSRSEVVLVVDLPIDQSDEHAAAERMSSPESCHGIRAFTVLPATAPVQGILAREGGSVWGAIGRPSVAQFVSTIDGDHRLVREFETGPR